MTVKEALEIILADGFRGPGCAAIHMVDGSKLFAVGDGGLVECITDSGDLLYRLPAEEICGEVDGILWSCDQLGGILA